MTTEQFIKKAKLIHGYKYDYSLVEYVNSKTKVKIICKEHGVFEQAPTNHLSKQGCPECSKISRASKKKLSKNEFNKRMIELYNDDYDFSQSEYINNHTKIKIICKKHGEFQQSPMHLLKGQIGCYECYKNKFKKSKTFTTEQFIEKAKKFFPEYDYSITNYTNAQSKIKYICHKHGINEVVASSLLNGCGCKKCGIEKSKETKRIKKENLFFKKYDYLNLSKFTYSGLNSKSIVICPEHGEYKISPAEIKRGNICPQCIKQYGNTGHSSAGEIKIINYLNSNKINFVREVGFFDCKDKKQLPFDFYIKDYNLLLEFNGKQHYEPVKHFGGMKALKLQQEHDLIKKEYALQNNYNYFVIPYWEDVKKTLDKYFTEKDYSKSGQL